MKSQGVRWWWGLVGVGLLFSPGMGAAFSPFEDGGAVTVGGADGGIEVLATAPAVATASVDARASAAELWGVLDLARRHLESGDPLLAGRQIALAEWLIVRQPELAPLFNPALLSLRARLEAAGLAVLDPGAPVPLPPAISPADAAMPAQAPSRSPSTSSGPTDPLVNEVQYGLRRIREKMASGDPTLQLSVTWTERQLARLRARQDPADHRLILEALSTLREAARRVAEQAAVAAPAPGPSAPPAPAPTATLSPRPSTPRPASSARPPAPTASPGSISAAGRRQMARVVEYARANHRGASRGMCFNAVWGYLTSSGYGRLDDWNDLPRMGSGEARFFAEYLNASPAHLDEAGLQRLDTALRPPITSPHDRRIPDGAVIVVAAGSTGCAHPTAGDITIKAGGRFINDGPDMWYGTASTWRGRLLGVYVPR